MRGGWGSRSLCNSFSSAPSFSHFSPAPVWVLHELQLLQDIPNCSGVGHGVDICSNLVFSMGCRGISALVVPGAPPPLPYFLALVSILLFLTFPPFIPLLVQCFHKGATQLAAGLSCVLQWVLCEPSWSCLGPSWGSCCSTSCSLPTP